MNNTNENITLIEGGVRQENNSNKRWMSYCVASILFFITLIGLIVSYSPHHGNKRNVVIMISDGFGPASETYGRSFAQYLRNSSYGEITPLDKILVGQSRTRSSSSLITDSAAGATAFSCGIKSYNGAIGVDSLKQPCGTILEAAKDKGYFTGLVATSRITHATPASFSAHVTSRDMEDIIAQHQLGFYPLGRSVDLMFGGGKCHFIAKNDTGSCRADNKDLIKDGKDKGWKFIFDKKEFNTLKNPKFPLAGLFANDHMDYDIDRQPDVQPSLKEMAEKALDILSKATKKKSSGFFLMIEGSRIDMAAHSNDPAAHARDILAYYDAVQAVKQFVEKNPNTVMISVSDHETGGFTVGRQLTEAYPEYIWYPQVIANVKASSVKLAKEILQFTSLDKASFIKNLIKNQAGIVDITDDELSNLESNNFSKIMDTISDMVSRRANLGWTTHGHTGVDVNLYAYGSNSHLLNGNKENTYIGSFMEQFLDIDLNKITKKISKWKANH